MAIRIVNGNDHTEDGWPLVDRDGCNWITVPGTDVRLQIQKGQPTVLLGAWAADWHTYIERLRDEDSACWTESNDVLGQPGKNNGSNHLGGTAIDLNWRDHPFRQRGSLNAVQMAVMAEMEDFYEETVFWAGRWDDPADEMHSQCGYNTFNNPHTQDFINRKIRPDGFSTFRRGDAQPQPPVLSRADKYALLIIAEGQRRGITPRGIKITLATGLVESNLTVYANAKVPASMSIPHDAVGSDGYSVGIFQQQVRDSGNGWWWGDAATCMDPTSSAGLFYDRLARLDYNGSNSPGSYAQTVQQSAFPDRYDQRFSEAEQIYNRLIGQPPPTPPLPGDDMALVPQEQWDRVYRELTQRLPSRSPLRHLGEGLVDTMAGMLLNTDSSQHVEIVKLLASLGHPESLALLREVASADPVRYPDRQADKLIAQAILADLNNPAPASAPAPVFTPPVVYESPPSTNGKPKSTGDTIGNLYTALEEMHLADALPIEARAPLAALIAVLQTKNGSQV